MTARSSALRLRRGGARPQLVAHGVPVHAVHRLVEVRVADDRPHRVERLRRLAAPGPRQQPTNADDGDRSGDRAALHHLMSALISGGGSNVDGATLSYSTEVNVSTCSTPIAVCLIVVGTSRSPNFL